MLRRALLLAAASMLLNMPAQATDTWTLGVHVATAHIPARQYQNNFNPGAYVVAPNGVAVGAYHNTVRRTSVYVGYQMRFKHADLLLGGVTGYKEELGHAVMPLVAVSRAFDIGLAWKPRVTYVPKATPKSSHLLHLSFESTY